MPLNIPTEWAQREDFLHLTFKHTAVNDGKVEFQKKKIIFTGTNGKDTYETTIDLFDEIKTEGNKVNKRGPGYECVVYKENASWWPRLFTNKGKIHWLKVDFKRWKDEDDSEVEEDYGGDDMVPNLGGAEGGPGQPDLAAMMAQMGGGSPMGMDQMGDLGDSDSEVDSDDDDIPGLENESAAPTNTEVPPTKS